MLGRETAIERIVWEDDWPYVLEGKKIRTMIEAPSGTQQIHPKKSSLEYRFDGGELSKDFQSLRIPIGEEWCSLSARKGYLRLIGKESLNSFNQQSLIARRVQHFTIEVETQVDFNPENLMQLAGLVFLLQYWTLSLCEYYSKLCRNKKIPQCHFVRQLSHAVSR